ncbi:MULTISPECIES: Nif3-like dinuclear metal center hexameric protein [Sphingobacterium]|uniref:Nif3-like dinuclear metal center hexameric protein n=1 Tax=Sphingobacterium TaxID=28453 RepID=UPI000E955A91|nr:MULTISPECIES: Nif3-like dinuclear metal center hexameric protein [Sphingobacterium]HAF36909.1 Nif3-like dinuclear metal center hexameric protein [Sphingobacterium sp.]HAT91073.1 Nif3-like dinuclear metal center hexameric protein [Sphingobacterium sp.]
MKIKEVIDYLEQLAPLDLQESYDNAGLIVGDANREITKVLISLDCTEDVVKEAIDKGCNLIISHHPIVFRGLKKFNGKNYVERTVIKAIEHKVALYAIHTNLDNVTGGVNTKIADKLGLENQAILESKTNVLRKMVFFVPRSHVEDVRQALFDAGAGKIGKHYDQCSFNAAGYGSFRPLEGADPTLGEIGVQERVEETRIEVIYLKSIERKLLLALYEAHPYEEVAYDLFDIQNTAAEIGAGMIGNLAEPMAELEFLAYLKDKLRLNVIRHTALLDKKVSRVAVCGGSGGFLLGAAKRSGADFFVTADYKYHEFFDAEGEIVIADTGHFESEQFTQELLYDIITKKFPNFATLTTEIDTNPIKYYS